MARTVSIIGLETIGLVAPGDNVGRLIFAAMQRENLEFAEGDVVVISQKIVSKAENLELDISKIRPSRRARSISQKTGKDPRLIELILKDSRKVLRADKEAMIVQRKDGMICLNAGVDKSNVKGRFGYARLPVDAGSSADRIRSELEQLTGKKLGVIVADTYSRPFRVGQVEFAIGVSGIEPVIDYRGQEDMFGYRLKFKFVGLADEIAAAAELAIGQGTERIPVAILRGVPRVKMNDELRLSEKLHIGKRKDLFRKII